MKKVSIKARLLVSFGSLIVLNIVLGVFAITAFNEIVQNGTAAYINNSSQFFTVVMVISVLWGILLSILTIRAIRLPLSCLNEAVHKLGKGDINVELKKYNNDEFGALTDEVQNMVDNLKYQIDVATSAGKGDLTIKVETKGKEDAMGNILYALVRDNGAMLSEIKESTAQVTVGSNQVASASQSLAQGSTEQASAIQEITASMDEIAERTKENASEANEAHTLVKNIKEDVTRGDAQLNEMVRAMDTLAKSSENISKVIKVIDDIAFQTNILALNAAVEAARAGVHGKGFAVVAEEVRSLAAKSASAAKETAEMIEDSIQKSHTGAKMAEDTATALSGVIGLVDRIVELVSSIAVASNNQATAVSQIDQAITQVSQVVQTNSATSEQCAAASEELSSQAATLRSLVSHYKLAGTERQERGYSSHNYNEQRMRQDNEKIISLDSGYGKY